MIMFSEVSPHDPAISCEDAFDERGAIVSTKCTGCMDLVPQARQKDIP
jgi:predicted nucleic acid-binding Zn ribbon protein